jgi:hypothetical protein
MATRTRNQDYASHAHRPVATGVGYVFLLIAAAAFALRWFGIGGRVSFAVGLCALMGSIATILAISRLYITRLQDRIIRLEMRLRTAGLLTPEQHRLLNGLTLKQLAGLRFASDPELPALLERTARETLTPDDIKRAIRTWVADHDRT